jgi:uncharacterized protein YsxB (DUF464 family)
MSVVESIDFVCASISLVMRSLVQVTPGYMHKDELTHGKISYLVAIFELIVAIHKEA